MTTADCENGGYMWVPANSGPDGDDSHDGDHSDDMDDMDDMDLGLPTLMLKFQMISTLQLHYTPQDCLRVMDIHSLL